MALEEKLEALKAREAQETIERQSREEEEKRIEEEEEKKRTAKVEKLLRIAEEQLFPTFELVNEVYLEGKGELSLEKKEGEHETVSLKLDWGKFEYGAYGDDQTSGGQRLQLSLDHKKNALLSGAGRSPTLLFSLDDEGWEERLEDSILEILGTPHACSWSETYYGSRLR